MIDELDLDVAIRSAVADIVSTAPEPSWNPVLADGQRTGPDRAWVPVAVLSASAAAVVVVLAVASMTHDSAVPVETGVPIDTQAAPTTAPPTDTTVTIVEPNATVPAEILAGPAGSLLNTVLFGGRTFTDIEADVQAAIATCMAEKQFTYTPVDPAAGTEDLSLPMAEIQARRESIGYGIVSGEFAMPTTDPNKAYSESLEPEQQADYFAARSDPTNGCDAIAAATIHATVPFYQPAYASLTAEFSAELNANPRLNQSWDAWTQCIGEHGFDFEDPAAARAFIRDQATDLVMTTPRDNAGLADLQATEIAIATADTQCYITHVQPIKIDVETNLLDQWVTDGRLPAELWPT